jgi:hypothetical protein
MDTVQILCTLQNVKLFLGVFHSHFLQHSITRSGIIIVNVDPHTEKGSHWLAINFETKSSSAIYYDSFVISPIIPTIQTFLRRNCTAKNNTVQLQGLNSSLRPILLPIHPVHGQRLLRETIHRLFHC